jgi:F0F1-type ATP synthase delta subunit
MTQNKKEKARKVTDGILAYLNHDRVMDLLPEIVKLLEKIVIEKKDQIRVESAIELSWEEKNTILKNLKSKYSWIGAAEFTVNKEILGGLKVSKGDKTIDLSVSGKLNNIYEQF